jgi:hypothetical protein
MRFPLAALLVLLSLASPLFAATVEYDLTIAEQGIDLTGRPVAAMTINNTIPGPVLRFSEGDLARIRVRNAMATETSIHWHGVLVPPGMDGVPYVSFPPIAPGETFTYEFPLRQAALTGTIPTPVSRSSAVSTAPSSSPLAGALPRRFRNR